MFIEDLGWDAYFEAHVEWTARNAGCVPARVVSQHRGLWRVAGDFEECWAEPSGKFRKEVRGRGRLARCRGLGFGRDATRKTERSDSAWFCRDAADLRAKLRANKSQSK